MKLRTKILTGLAGIFLFGYALAQFPPLIVEEEDGSPTGVTTKIKVSNGTLTQNSTVMSIDTSGNILTSGADADSTNTDSDSGLELVSDQLTILRGCSDNQILKWDETADDWNCEADATAGGVDPGFDNAADPVVQQATGRDVHIGDGAGTLTGKFEIGGDADQPQIVVEGFSTQTDSILIIQNDADAEVFTIDVSGVANTLVGIDAIGAVDFDIGSGDVTDVTVTTDGGDIVLDGTITQDAGTTLFMGGLLDATGAVDMDYGSGDITDHTFNTDSTGDAEIVLPNDSIGPAELDSTTGAYDFGSVTSLEIPNAAAPTTDVTGEIALDTTITDHQPLIQYFDGGENMTVIAIDTAQLPATDNEIVKYDAATDKFVLEADAGGGSGAFDDAGDPIVQNTTTKDVHVGDGAGTLTGKLEIGGDADQPQFVVEGFSTQTDSLAIFQNDADTEVFTIDVSGLPSSLVGIDAIGAVDFDIGSTDVTDVTVTTDGGDIVLDGTITQDAGTTLFMGGLLDATGAVDMDYGSSDITDHTFTTDGTGTAEIVLPAGSIDSTEILDLTVVTGDIADDTITFDNISDSSAIDADTVFTAADAIDFTFTPTHTNGDTDFFTLDSNQTDDADGTDDFDVMRIEMVSESGDAGDTYEGLVISQEAGTANTIIDAGIRIENLENATDTMTDAIIIEATTADAITDGIDVSDTELTNSINVGANPIVTGNVAGTIGDSTTDSWTFTTDGTGTAEIVLPAGSIDSTEVLDTTLVDADMANDALDADKIVDDVTDDNDLDVVVGGTGVSALTDGGVMLGSGTGDVTVMAVLADSELIVGDGTTDPVAESGDTLRTSVGVGFDGSADPNLMMTITDDVHIGDGAGTLTGKLEIGGDADQPQLVIEGFSTQTNSIVIIQNDADTEVATIDVSGIITTLVGIDAIGAVDFDIGSADVTDVTAITDG